MSLSSTNRKDIVADSIGVITENEIVDLTGAINEKAPQVTTYTVSILMETVIEITNLSLELILKNCLGYLLQERTLEIA